MFRSFITLLCFIIPLYNAHAELPADISFIVIDLKYNDEDGVKICEVQEGTGSTFHGVEFLSGRKGVIAEKLCEILERHTSHFWFFSSGISKEFLPTFQKNSNWKEMFSTKHLSKDKSFSKWNKKKIKSQNSLSSYHGILVSHYQCLPPSFLNKMKGVLLLDAAFLPHFGDASCTDKLTMSRLFDIDEELASLKPKWVLYEKNYSKQLVDTIHNDFSTEYLVIKPRIGSRGRGVLIIHRDELDATLQYILGHSTALKNDPDKSYHYWYSDKNPHFFVEEFYPSTDITVPHMGTGRYDATIRIPTVLTYDEGQVDVEFLYFFWKLPPKSLDEEGTLTEKHKSFSQSTKHFDHVDQNTKEKIIQQLKEPLLRLYKGLVD